MSVNRIEKQNVGYLYNVTLYSYENEQTLIELNNNDVPHKYNTKQEKPEIKNQIVYYFINIKFEMDKIN